MDVYGRLVPGSNKAVVDRLDDQARTAEAAQALEAPERPVVSPW